MGERKSAFKRFAVVVLLLVLTNAGTFLFVQWRCRLELEGQEELMNAVRVKTQELRVELSEAEAELDRLSVWGDFIRLQQELNSVTAQINELNYGNAIDRLQAIREGIGLGEYGTVFQERRAELVPILERTEQSLRRTEKEARRHLVAFNERAFGILSGLESSLAPPPATEEGGDESPAPAEPMDTGEIEEVDEAEQIEETEEEPDADSAAAESDPDESPNEDR